MSDLVTNAPTSNRLCDSLPPLGLSFPIWHSDCMTPHGNHPLNPPPHSPTIAPSGAGTFPQKNSKFRGKTFVYTEKVIIQNVSQKGSAVGTTRVASWMGHKGQKVVASSPLPLPLRLTAPLSSGRPKQGSGGRTVCPGRKKFFKLLPLFRIASVW